MGKQEEGITILKAMTYDFQRVVENHLGVDAFAGQGTAEERAQKVSLAIVGTTMLMERLVAVALIQKLEKCPNDIENAKRFTDKMVVDMSAMLKQRMDMVVAEAMEQIAFAVLTQKGASTTEH